MKESLRELFLDIVSIQERNFKNKQITLFPCLTFIPKTSDSFFFFLRVVPFLQKKMERDEPYWL